MTAIFGRWREIGIVVGGLKILAILLIPASGDLINWTSGASQILVALSSGKMSSLFTAGAYAGTEVVLAPFFWLWTILPIAHPPIRSLVDYTTPSILLALLMKLPIFLSDIAAGILITRLVGRIVKSEERVGIGFLSWFANPFNFHYLYVYDAMDVIPAAIVLLALTMGWNNRWARCGFTTTIAGLLRLYPFVALPFYLPLTKTKPARINLIFWSMLPIACAVILVYASGAFAAILSIPLRQYWILEFLGGNIAGGQSLWIAPVLILTQLFVVLRFWKANPNIVHLATVSFLALLLGATPYGGSEWHFIWVSPLLSLCLAMHPEESWIFALTFVTAYLSPAAFPLSLTMIAQTYQVVDNFLAGAFYAMKATYLVRLNLWNIKLDNRRLPPNLRKV